MIKTYLYNLDPSYYGAFENKCMVIRNGTEISQMCVPKGAQGKCETNTGNISICCCETSNCNDDAFVDNCKSGTSPTVKTEILPTSKPSTLIPKGLTCNLVAGPISTTQDCSSK